MPGSNVVISPEVEQTLEDSTTSEKLTFYTTIEQDLANIDAKSHGVVEIEGREYFLTQLSGGRSAVSRLATSSEEESLRTNAGEQEENTTERLDPLRPIVIVLAIASTEALVENV